MTEESLNVLIRFFAPLRMTDQIIYDVILETYLITIKIINPKFKIFC
jgi:hypothetical protein